MTRLKVFFLKWILMFKAARRVKHEIEFNLNTAYWMRDKIKQMIEEGGEQDEI